MPKRIQALTVRVRADRTGGEGSRDPNTGAWPFAGLEHADGEWPAHIRVPQKVILHYMANGWVTGEGHEVVTRPAGTAAAPWAPTPTAPGPHVFHHYQAFVFHTPDGTDDARYRVVHQPDKYVASKGPTAKVTDEVYASGDTRVDWFYEMELDR